MTRGAVRCSAWLGDFAHLLRVMNAQQDIPSPVPSSKLHGLKTSTFESIASRTFWPSVARVDSAAGVFEITRRESTASPKASLLGVSREAHTPRRSKAQQLRASRQRGAYWLSSVACVSPSPSFPDIHVRAPIASPGVAPELFSGVCPNPMKSPNHALQRTAPRVTARAFCERSAIYIWASAVRSTVGHAPRHAPPSLSLGSLGVLCPLFRE